MWRGPRGFLLCFWVYKALIQLPLSVLPFVSTAYSACLHAHHSPFSAGARLLRLAMLISQLREYVAVEGLPEPLPPCGTPSVLGLTGRAGLQGVPAGAVRGCPNRSQPDPQQTKQPCRAPRPAGGGAWARLRNGWSGSQRHSGGGTRAEEKARGRLGLSRGARPAVFGAAAGRSRGRSRVLGATGRRRARRPGCPGRLRERPPGGTLTGPAQCFPHSQVTAGSSAGFAFISQYRNR